MISRRTTIFFSIAMACFSVLRYRTWEQERPCREWKHNHVAGQAEPAPVQQPDGSFAATFVPCNLWHAMAWLDKALVLLGFASSVAFIISLIQDVLVWQKKRRRLIKAAPGGSRELSKRRLKSIAKYPQSTGFQSTKPLVHPTYGLFRRFGSRNPMRFPDQVTENACRLYNDLAIIEAEPRCSASIFLSSIRNSSRAAGSKSMQTVAFSATS